MSFYTVEIVGQRNMSNDEITSLAGAGFKVRIVEGLSKVPLARIYSSFSAISDYDAAHDAECDFLEATGAIPSEWGFETKVRAQ